jgi:carboxylesterase
MQQERQETQAPGAALHYRTVPPAPAVPTNILLRRTLPLAILGVTLAASLGAARAYDYDTAVAAVRRRQAEDDSVVVTGARTILMLHGAKTPRVFVLLHGFTDAPTQFEQLGYRFFALGDNVYIPRLPHHAERDGKVRALGRITAGELEAFGDSCVDIAKALGDSIIVVGLSAGGNVTGSIAQRRKEVLRAVLVAPALAAGRVSDDLGRQIIQAGSRLPNIVRSEAADTARPEFVQGISTRGLAQVLKLGDMIRVSAATTPAAAKQIVFLLNQNDVTVSDAASIEVARAWTEGPPLVSVYQFPKALKLDHNVMEASDHGGNTELVFPVIEALALGKRAPEDAKYLFIVSDWNRPRAPF